MRRLHVPPDIVGRPSGCRRYVSDQQFFLAQYAVGAAAFPKASEDRMGHGTAEQVACDRCNASTPTKTNIQRVGLGPTDGEGLHAGSELCHRQAQPVRRALGPRNVPSRYFQGGDQIIALKFLKLGGPEEAARGGLFL